MIARLVRSLALAGVAAALALAAEAVAAPESAATPPARQCPAAGTTAPLFTLPRARGGAEISLAGLLAKKHPVVIDFWRHDCAQCLVDLPELQKLAAEWGEKISVVTVHSDSSEGAEANMLAALEKWAVTLPTGFDAYRKVGERYCIDAFPQLWVLDESGNLVAHVQGEQKEFAAAVRAAVAPLLHPRR